jgi:hypothetical protein
MKPFRPLPLVSWGEPAKESRSSASQPGWRN